MKISRGVLILAGAILFNCCQGSGMDDLQLRYSQLEAISPDRWEDLSQKRLFFGHKSVGDNIILGLREVMARKPEIRLNIRETMDVANIPGPIFAHAPLGRNKAPFSKIEAFRELMESGVGEAADVALLKFCFVDIDHETDIQALFASYDGLVDDLKQRFPRLKVVTSTVPLMSMPFGLKNRLKKLLGRMPGYDEDNVQRNLFNDMLRARFKESLFDLAAAESSMSGKKRATFRKGGKEYELLYRPFTDDGGHLSLTGRQVVAIELLKALASLDPSRP